MTAWRHSLWVGAAIHVLGAPPLGAQEVKQIPLGPADATAPREFSNVVGVRELSDGSAIVSDQRESGVYHVAFGDGPSAGVLGRVGDGPREYRSVTAPYPLGPDSTVFVDLRRDRWVLIDGPTLRGDLDLYRAARSSAGRYLVGGTEDGWVFGRAVPPEARTLMRADSLFLVRLRRGPIVDTLTVLDGIGGGPLRQAAPGQFVSANPLVLRDEAAVAPGGDVAVLRHSPYRVEWYRASGTREGGGPIESEFPVLTEEGRCAALNGGLIPMPDGECRAELWDDWPDRAPPYSSWASVPPVFAPRGDLALVRRFLPDQDSGNLYDVIDGEGHRIAQLQLGDFQYIVGVSERWVYVVSVDSYGLQTLSRHPMPVT